MFLGLSTPKAPCNIGLSDDTYPKNIILNSIVSLQHISLLSGTGDSGRGPKPLGILKILVRYLCADKSRQIAFDIYFWKRANQGVDLFTIIKEKHGRNAADRIL